MNDSEKDKDYEDFIASCIETSEYSSDYPKVAKSTSHLIFVYGTLKSTKNRGRILDGCPKIGTGITTFSMYKLYNYKRGNFPVALSGYGGTAEGFGILGEVYLVPSSIIARLDYIESNGYMFDRTLTYVSMQSKKYKVNPILKVNTYIGNTKYWKEELESGELKLMNVYNNLNGNEPRKFYIY